MPSRKVSDEEIVFLRKLGFSGYKIAKMRHMSPASVYACYRKLVKQGYIQNMDSKKVLADALRKLAKKRHLHYAKQVQATLYKNGGLMQAKNLLKQYSCNLISKLLRERIIVKVWFSLKRGTGTFKQRTLHKIFKKDYVGRVWYCINNRTIIVRLIMNALIPPKTPTHQKILTAFLRRHLSKAEQLAVLWNCGIRNFSYSQVPSSIQIDGIVQPKGEWKQ